MVCKAHLSFNRNALLLVYSVQHCGYYKTKGFRDMQILWGSL